MSIRQIRARAACASLLITALAALVLAGSAPAKLTGAFTVFEQCPYEDPAVEHCIHSVTESGEVVLGSKKVRIIEPVTLRGGIAEAKFSKAFAKLAAAKDGVTLSKTSQPVPGGLLGIVSPKGSSPLVKTAIAFFFENGLTGVSATLEFARPLSDVLVSQQHFAEQERAALRMPVKIHLENPFLGSSCFIGSSSSPIIFELTTGKTAPPGPNKPILGSVGEFELLEKTELLRAKNTKLVDNAWSAPRASGCGGFLSFLIDPIINSQIGLPTAAGENTAVLIGTLTTSPSQAVKANDEANS